MDLNCTYTFAKNNEPKLTVGDVFQARCVLPSAAPVDVNKLKIKVPPPMTEGTVGVPQAAPPKLEANQKYDVVVVKAAQGGDELGLALTSYIVGPKDIPEFTITDGTQDFTIKTPLRFEVQSVLKQDEKPEMYGPMSGLTVVIPLFYWVLLGCVLFFGISSLAAVTRARIKRKKLLQKIDALDDGTQPIQQYFTMFRRLQRENAIFSARSQVDNLMAIEPVQSPDELLRIIKSVESALKLYLARTFRITMFESSWKAITNELNNYHDFLFSVVGPELVELASEFQKAGVGKNKIEPKDAILISEKTRRWIEKADQLNKAILAKDNQLIRKLKGAR